MTIKITETTLSYIESPLKLYATLYKHMEKTCHGVLLYFHGGGLLYGSRNDLPSYHIETLCNSGYAIIAFDYRLAPATKLPEILEDVITAVRWYLDTRLNLLGSNLPYFLWGRSAGAYLVLLTALRDFSEPPRGVISYYGYTFLNDHWFNTPNKHYLQFPMEDEKHIYSLHNSLCATAPLEQRYGLYVHARQTGKWISLFFEGKEKHFYAPYSFRLVSNLKNYPATFLAHSLHDPDVPFDETKELKKLLPTAKTFFTSVPQHDFDRNYESHETTLLLNNTLDFLNSLI